ncbi:MAG: Asp23/Gls24 family envelope stress response protein [Eubacterium sp.]|nr:Asp23/Gls24 family envelope stress response protein [Eubacterium sp.]
MEEEKKATLTIRDDEGIGFIQIADDVVSNIAGLAATEADGVARLSGNVPNELISKLGKKSLSKGIRVTYADNTFTVDVSVIVKFGFNIVEVSRAVQEKVIQALLTMTGLTVSKVNVRVAGVDFSEK